MKKLLLLLTLLVATGCVRAHSATPPRLAAPAPKQGYAWWQQLQVKPAAPAGSVKPQLAMGVGFPATVPLTALQQGGAASTNVLAWNGSAWAPSAGGGGGISALTGDVTASGSGSVAAEVVSVHTQSGPFQVNNPGVTNFSTGNNGAISYELTTTTSSTTPNTSMTFPLPGTGGLAGNFTVVVSGRVTGTTTGVSQIWTGYIVDNAGTCAVMATNGAFTAQPLASNGTVAATPVSVALSTCNVVATVTGTSATNWVWSETIQAIVAGP